eukprot:tig00021126_g18471.t1
MGGGSSTSRRVADDSGSSQELAALRKEIAALNASHQQQMQAAQKATSEQLSQILGQMKEIAAVKAQTAPTMASGVPHNSADEKAELAALRAQQKAADEKLSAILARLDALQSAATEAAASKASPAPGAPAAAETFQQSADKGHEAAPPAPAPTVAPVAARGHGAVMAAPDAGAAAPTKEVFISYSSRNKELVHPLVREMEENPALRGHVWLDVNEIKAGQQGWRSQIAQAANAAKVAVCFLSPEYFASVPCGIELDLFAERREMKKGISIVPVMLEGGIPDAFKFHLAGLQYVDWSRRHLIVGTVASELAAMAGDGGGGGGGGGAKKAKSSAPKLKALAAELKKAAPAPAPAQAAKESAPGPPAPPGAGRAPAAAAAMPAPPARAEAEAEAGDEEMAEEEGAEDESEYEDADEEDDEEEELGEELAEVKGMKSNTKELKMGFCPGPWKGFWRQGGQTGEMELTLSLYFRTVRAEGSDRVGTFVIRGSYDVDAGTVRMLKTYTGPRVFHSLVYEGKMRERKVCGRWWEENASSNTGEFELWHSALAS